MALSLVTNYVSAGRRAAATITGSYTALLAAVSASGRKIIITNTLDQETVLSINNGVNDLIYLPANQGIIIDLDTSTHWSGIVSIKHNGVAPASGVISAGVICGA